MRVTAADARLIADGARACGQTVSEFMRGAVIQSARGACETLRLVRAGLTVEAAADTLLHEARERIASPPDPAPVKALPVAAVAK